MRAAPTPPSLLLAGLLAGACGPQETAPPAAAPRAPGPQRTTLAPPPDLAAAALAEARELLGAEKLADPPAALARLEAVFGTAPSDPEAAFLLARAAFRSEEPERCTLALDAWFEREPVDRPDWSAEAWVLRGWLLERAGRPAEALPHHERALAVSPGYAFALLRKGCALADSGDAEGAIGSLEQAIELRPGLLEAHFALAQAYRRAGRAGDAEREARIHRLLNQTSDNSANTRESVTEKFAAFEELERLLPQWIEGRLTLTRMQLKLGRGDLALARMRRLVAEQPESVEARALLEQIERAGRGGGR